MVIFCVVTLFFGVILETILKVNYKIEIHTWLPRVAQQQQKNGKSGFNNKTQGSDVTIGMCINICC